MSELREVIQQKYGEAARRAATGEEKSGCCGTGCGCSDPITSDLYAVDQTSALPAEARSSAMDVTDAESRRSVVMVEVPPR